MHLLVIDPTARGCQTKQPLPFCSSVAAQCTTHLWWIRSSKFTVIWAPEAISPAQSATYQDIARLSAPEAREATGATPKDSPIQRVVTGLVSRVLSNVGTHSLRDRADAVLFVVLGALDVSAGFIATYDEDRDDLVISAARGLGGPSIEGRRMELGEHLTGWVAANGQPMMNSEAALDLAVLAPGASTILTLCLKRSAFR